MKTIKKTKFLLLAVIVFLAASLASAQDTELSKKERKRQERKELLSENLKTIKSAVKDSAFVLEVDNIRGRHTFTNFVNPNTNFIQVAGDEITVQTANNHRIGYNGLGGITVSGTIRHYEIYQDDASIRLSIQMSSTALGFSTVNISINASGNATADIRTNFGGYAQFYGEFATLENSSTYEGITIF